MNQKLFNIFMILALWVTLLIWLVGIIAPMQRRINKLERDTEVLYQVITVGAEAPSINFQGEL